MKFLFVGYIVMAFLLGFYGIAYSDKTDKNGYFKFNWPLALALVLNIVSPLVAKICGLL